MTSNELRFPFNKIICINKTSRANYSHIHVRESTKSNKWTENPRKNFSNWHLQYKINTDKKISS